jgi:c-di-GMP-binding flagellar brake protein YcgR
MLEFLTRASALAKQTVLPGFLAQGVDIDRGKPRPEPEPYVDFMDGPYQIIRDKRQIMCVLQKILDARRPVSLTGRSGLRTADTRLLLIDAARDRILLRELMNDASHSRLLLDGRVNITARHMDVPLLFTLELSGSGSFDGIPCYMAPIPEWVLFAQMRDSFRVCLPQALGARLSFHVTGVGPIEGRVLDISESGLSALVPPGLTRTVTVNDTFRAASLRTQDGTLSPLGLKLRYVGSAVGGPQRIGAALDLSTESLRQNIRRLILRHQSLHARAD